MTQLLAQLAYLAAGALILLGSGLGIVWLMPPLRRSLTAMETAITALMLSSGVCGVWVLIGRAMGLKIAAWSLILAAASLILAAAGWLARRASRAEARVEPDPRPLRWTLILLAALAFVLVWRDGGSLGPVHDSLDFVSFVNETLQSGDLSPASPIYRSAPGIPPDPRRGSFHTELSAICWLSGARPTDAWRWLPRLLVPLAVLGLGALFRVWLGARAAWLATLLFLATNFFSVDRFIQNIGYASRFGWVCGWAALIALAKGSAHGAERRPGERRALLAVAAVGPPILLSVHLLSGFQTMIALGCAGLAILSDRGATAGERKGVAAAIAASIVLFVPALVVKMGGHTKVVNPLFDQVFGVMFVLPHWPILLPSIVADRLGATGIVGAVLALTLIPRIRVSRAAGFLAWSTLIPLLILFFPPIVRLVVAKHAYSVLSRVILTIPYAGALSWFVLRAAAWVREGGGGRRAGAVAILALIGLGLAAQIHATRFSWSVPYARREAYVESGPLIKALAFLDERFPAVQTILSDPVSSYSIPAYTRHDAVAPFEQHSSPVDSTVARRIQDVQEALNARVGMARTFRVIRRYHVDLILLNQSFGRYLTAYSIFLTPLVYADQRAKFEAAPQYFERIYDAGGIAIYRVHDPGPAAALPGDPPNPDRIPDPGLPALMASGPVELLQLTPRDTPQPPGGWLTFDMIWRRGPGRDDLPTICEIKAELEGARVSDLQAAVARLRNLLFPSSGQKLVRIGRSFRPLVTFYPDFLWAPGETYKDTFWMPIPPGTTPGTYEVWARMRTEPYLPVVTLREMLSSGLGREWRRFGEVRITSPAAAGPQKPG